MPVIKPAMHRTAKLPTVVDMNDLAREAEDIIDQARHRAAEILADAKKRAEQIQAQAREEGFATGREQGHKAGHAEGIAQGSESARRDLSERLQQLDSAWSAALAKWSTDKELLYDQARDDVVNLAVSIAQRVTHRVIAADPSIIHDQVMTALHLLGMATQLKIDIHPDDAALLEAMMPHVHQFLGSGAQVTINASSDVSRGGCVLISGPAEVDATINMQIARIAEAIGASPLRTSKTESTQ